MDLAQSVQDFIQAGRSLFTALKWLLSLTGLRAPESGVDRRVVRTIIIVPRLCLVHHGFPLPSRISDVPGSLVPLRANQLSSPAQKRVIRLVKAAIVLGFSLPRCLASHSSRILCLKAARASASGQSTIWFFLVRNLFQSLRANSPGCCIMRLKSSASGGQT